MKSVVLMRVDRLRDDADHPRHLHPALDLKIVEAGLVARGIATALVDGWLLPEGVSGWIERVEAFSPGVVVVKAESWCIPEAIECASRLRRRGIRTVAIGQQVSHAMQALPAGWREAFDLAIAGEPEERLLLIIPELLHVADPDLMRYWQDFEQGRHVQINAPDALPLPQFGVAEMERFAFPFPLPGLPLRRWAYVLGARGCPYHCRHCSTVVRKSWGDSLRGRSPGQVVDEVAMHLAAGAQALAFEDDTLLVDKRRFIALCDEMLRRQIVVPWIANARPDELDDERVDAAANAGAKLLKLGIETDAPRLIELMGKARRGADWQLATEAGMTRLRRHHISTVGLFLVGLPTQTRGEVETTLDWACRLAPDYVQVQIFRSYPDIPWWQELPAVVRDTAHAYHYGPIAQTAAAIPARELPALQREFYRRFYFRPGFMLAHVRHCWRHYLGVQGVRRSLERIRYVLGQPVGCGVADDG